MAWGSTCAASVSLSPDLLGFSTMPLGLRGLQGGGLSPLLPFQLEKLQRRQHEADLAVPPLKVSCSQVGDDSPSSRARGCLSMTREPNVEFPNARAYPACLSSVSSSGT